MFNTKEEFIRQYKDACIRMLGKSFEDCDKEERAQMLCRLLAANAKVARAETARETAENKKKQVYYFSMEFLIGKLLENYLMNFGVLDLVREGLGDLGEDLESLYAFEPDPGLGNGGLGRLAACFIDSLASLGYAGHGNGIRYRYGLFHQEIKDGRQVELPDNWLEKGYPWEQKKPENSVLVRFGGSVECRMENGEYKYRWVGGEPILAVPYDVPVVGYGGKTVNTLRLWQAEPYREDFDMDAYNRGDYSGAFKFRADVEAITAVLYPSDSADPGKRLRLKQEYMFVCAGINNILRSYERQYGPDWKNLPEHVAIQTNDTHPSLCGAELMRIFVDEKDLSWAEAWDIVTRTVSYTNHTILPEALEKWPIDMFRQLLPRIYEIVEEIDRRYRDTFPRDRENWQELLRKTAILWDGQVRTANLSVICGHAVNGVAALHTEILKANVLKEFYELAPEKFNNKTNGITHRRFLAQANPSLAKLITDSIGDKWYTDCDELEKLLQFKNDRGFMAELEKSKKENKVRLANYIFDTTGVVVDTNSIFDVQVKRFHAYKRQLLNVLKIMDLYSRLITDPSFDMHPTTFIFAGKAAQGYEFAKDVIRLVNSVADVINNDRRVRGRIKVAFVPNFSVSNAQYIYPASDISEQISTAGMEASGTGNMKFMMNGAITLGTLDGANVEIAKVVGDENVEIFGLRTEEVDRMKREHSYFAWDLYNSDWRVKRIVDQLIDGTFSGLSGGFNGIYDELLRANDFFFVLKDFHSYVDSWHKLEDLYKSDKKRWNEISLTNIAKSGFFSSDRTIRQYAEDIWGL